MPYNRVERTIMVLDSLRLNVGFDCPLTAHERAAMELISKARCMLMQERVRLRSEMKLGGKELEREQSTTSKAEH